MNFLAEYGATEGPLGFPMRDAEARAVEQIIKSLPKTPEYEYRKAVAPNALTELNQGERSDVSWISTESPDRMNEVVRAKGMNDSQFAKNPLVTLQHNYSAAPVGRSLWRKRIKEDGGLVGIKAKTKYPSMPDNWGRNEHGVQEPWPPDKVLSLIQAQLLSGKSIGFLPLKAHTPDDKEYTANGWSHNTVQRVFDEWLLLEYSVCFLPANQDSLVEAVSKGLEVPKELLDAIGFDQSLLKPKAASSPAQKDEPAPIIGFTPLETIEEAIGKQLAVIDYGAIVEQSIAAGLDRARGRI